jgi:hypothetical protein
VGVIVISSPSVSLKYPARGIEIDFPWAIEWLGNALVKLGAELVTLTVNA